MQENGCRHNAKGKRTNRESEKEKECMWQCGDQWNCSIRSKGHPLAPAPAQLYGDSTMCIGTTTIQTQAVSNMFEAHYISDMTAEHGLLPTSPSMQHE